MIRIALPLSLVAAALLGACGSMKSPPSTSTSTGQTSRVATQEIPYYPGSGVVQSVTQAPTATAAAGASGAAPKTTPGTPPAATTPRSSSGAPTGTGMYRLGIRMEDGRTQYVDMMGPDVPTAGTRVRLTPDKQIIREQ